MHTYPTAADLARMGITLACDVSLHNAELARWFGRPYVQAVRTYAQPDPTPEAAQPPHSKRVHAKKAPTDRMEYKSIYVGVTTRRGRWVAQWGPRGKTTCKVFGKAAEDERAAAAYRAQALGLDAPEVRR